MRPLSLPVAPGAPGSRPSSTAPARSRPAAESRNGEATRGEPGHGSLHGEQGSLRGSTGHFRTSTGHFSGSTGHFPGSTGHFQDGVRKLARELWSVPETSATPTIRFFRRPCPSRNAAERERRRDRMSTPGQGGPPRGRSPADRIPTPAPAPGGRGAGPSGGEHWTLPSRALVTFQGALVTFQGALVTFQGALVTSERALVTSQAALDTSPQPSSGRFAVGTRPLPESGPVPPASGAASRPPTVR